MTPTPVRFILELVMESAPRPQLSSGPQPRPGAPLPQAPVTQRVLDTRRRSGTPGDAPQPHLSAPLLGDNAQDFVPTDFPTTNMPVSVWGRRRGAAALGVFLPPLQGWPRGALGSTAAGELPSKDRGVDFLLSWGAQAGAQFGDSREMGWGRRKGFV